jgi:hypothetical protein
MAHVEAVQHQVDRIELVISAAVRRLQNKTYIPPRKHLEACVDCLVDIVDQLKPYTQMEGVNHVSR